MYKHFEVIGDSSINKKINQTFSRLLGVDNHRALYTLYDIAKSNAEFAVYTTIFDLWKFVRHKPDERGWPNTKANINRAANLWEVYWGAVFEDRALWNLGEQDLDSIFNSLLYSRYKPLIDFISLGVDVDLSQMNLNEEESQWEIETVFPSHSIWQSTITDLPPFINQVRSANKKSVVSSPKSTDTCPNILGYSSTTMRHSIPSCSHQISAFGLSKDDSRKRLKYKLCKYHSLTPD
jgi:hypothetical protein